MLALFPSRAIFLQIGSFGIHWYGVMYLLAFIIAYISLPKLQKYRDLHLSHDEWASMVSWAVVGVILGGRLGYVIFYEPVFFFTHPLQIFAVWNGGMSFHGGLIGVILCLVAFCRKRKINLWKVADTVVVPVAIGLMLGRIGNFINLELYGTVTTLPWGIAIPGVEGLRHPTQIYSAFKDLCIAGVCFLHLSRVKPMEEGKTFALFLMLYGIGRFLVEFVRAQQYPLVDILGIFLTRGQLLTIPVFIAGVILWVWFSRRSAR